MLFKTELGAAILPHLAVLDLATKHLSHELMPITNTENRHTHIKDGRVTLRCPGLVYRRWATGEDEGARGTAREFDRWGRAGDYLREDLRLAHPSCDELSVLSAEVKDENASSCCLVAWHWLPLYADAGWGRPTRRVVQAALVCGLRDSKMHSAPIPNLHQCNST